MNELENTLQSRSDVDVGSGVSDAEITEAEDALGVRFPRDLRCLLLKFGFVSVGSMEFFGLGSHVPRHLELVHMTVSERTGVACPLPANLVPLLNDGGGNHFCIDTQAPNEGRVVFWDHDLGTDQVPDHVAESLVDWLFELLHELDSERDNE